MNMLNNKKTPIEKYQYLSVLRNTNVNLFYRLLSSHVKVRSIDSKEHALEKMCQDVMLRSDWYAGAYAVDLYPDGWRGVSEMERDIYTA